MRVLLIASSGARERQVRERLLNGSPEAVRLTRAPDLTSALEQATAHAPDVLIADLDTTPPLDADALACLCTNAEAAPWPVLTLSDRGDDPRALRSVAAGAQDHLGLDRTASDWPRVIDRARARHRRLLDLHAHAARDREVRIRDALTGLHNRQHLEACVDAEIARARVDRRVAVLLIDLDRFKTINDSLGHRAGDCVLREMATRISPLLGDGDVAARVGADQFAVLLAGVPDADRALSVAASIREKIERPTHHAGRELFLTASVGIALHPEHGAESVALLRNADAAVSSAKAFGGNSDTLYAQRMNESSLDLLSLEGDLRLAIERRELRLHFQPVVDGRDGRMVGAEALARWRHPRLGMVPPAEFIPLAEDTGLIEEIGAWVMQTACAQIRCWQQAGERPVPISVNVSPRQFWSGDFHHRVERALRESGIQGTQLGLEITESCLLRDVETTASTLRAVRALGVRVSIDDFGTGYSSFNALRRLPLDVLKVDQGFVSGVPDEEDASTLTAAILGLAASMNLAAVAEGVETAEQCEFLLEHGCSLMQGFYFSAPLPADDFARILHTGRSLLGAQKRPKDPG